MSTIRPSILALLSSLGLGALAPEAQAVAPSQDVHQGIEPQRVIEFNPAMQARYRSSSRWQDFVQGEGEGWRAVFDEGSGAVYRMVGRGIELGPSRTAAEVEAGVLAFIERHPTLLGVEGQELRTRSVAFSEVSGMWYVDVDLLVQGAPIYRGGLTFRVKQGRLIMVGAPTYPGVPVRGSLQLTETDASELAIQAGPVPQASHTELEVQPIALPQELESGALELRMTWQVRSRTTEPPGRWVSFIDGETGELISVHNEIRFLTVSGEHHVRTLDGNYETSPMPLIEVSDGGTSEYADSSGTVGLSEGSIPMRGAYVAVENISGADAEVEVEGDFNWTDADATQAEIDSYVFLHHTYDWCQEVAPSVNWCSGSIESRVNITSGSCNAYYDGRVNFYEKAGSCNNTAEIADVNYHEWGHGFHDYSIRSGFFDGSLSEGAADTVSFLLTGDPEIAPYFYTSGGGIREVATDKIYPDDYTADSSAVHSNGLIFGGTFWDLWDLLVARHGEVDGFAATSQIFAGTLAGGPDIPSAYWEALAADDDNGDLSDGTPNYCDLLEAFGRHGLGEGAEGGGGLLLEHEPILSSTPEQEQLIEVDLIEVADCFDGSVGAAELGWRVDGGDWEVEPIDVKGARVEGSIPPLPMGSFVEYFVRVDLGGNDVHAPALGEITPYSYVVGDVLELYCEEFEGDDGGYTHELLAGEDVEGADDWQWGAPTGSAEDPEDAWSGANVWANDLGYDNYNGEYQHDKHNRLSSIEVQLEHYEEVFLQYRRWLSVEDAFYDQASILADGEQVWQNRLGEEDEHHLDSEWMNHAVDLGGAVDDGAVQISWDLESDGGLAFGGWTIDDVCLLAPATADNRLGITDFHATDDASSTEVVISWTNPRHAPVDSVVVVRSTEDWPSSPEDGVIIYEDDAPALETPVEIRDTEPTDLVYYAVYAHDGAEWLSWTVEGWNADTGIANGSGAHEPEDEDPEDGESPGSDPGEDPTSDTGGEDQKGAVELVGACYGCAAPAAPVAPWLGLALAGLVGLRRRRRS